MYKEFLLMYNILCTNNFTSQATVSPKSVIIVPNQPQAPEAEAQRLLNGLGRTVSLDRKGL